MELTELAQTQLIVLAVVLAMLGCWRVAVHATRRRLRDFADLARTLGVEAIHESDLLLRFQIDIDGRGIEVRYEHLGAAPYNGWYLITAIPLQGVSDLHSVEIRPPTRRSSLTNLSAAEFQDRFSVRDLGSPLHSSWLTDRIRKVTCAFYAQDPTLEPLMLEESKLIHRSYHPLRHFEGGGLRVHLMHQATIAAAIESAL